MKSALDSKVLVVTQSDVNAFLHCRRAWMWSSYFGLRERNPKAFGPLTLGTRVHKALEMFYGESRPLIPSYDWLVGRERAQLDASGVVFGVNEWESEADLGRIMLEGYEEWIEETGADADWEVAGVEERLTYPMLDGKVELRGKSDLRIVKKSDGSKLIVDHKTTANFANITTIAPYTPQLPTYMLLERLVRPDSDSTWLAGAAFNMLRKVKRSAASKPPYFERLEVRHNNTYMRNFWTRLNGILVDYHSVVEALDSGVDPNAVAYPTASSGCRYCPFKFPCLAQDDGSRVEDMLEDLFIQENPHARYNEEPADFIPDSATR